MPLLSRMFVRAALLHLAGGFTLGALLLSAKAGALPAQFWLLLPTHVDALLMGWMVQLAMGVGYWVLPRRGALGRGRGVAAVTAFVLLNVGSLACQMSTVFALMPGMAGGRGPALAIGMALQAAAVAAFILHAWPRVISSAQIEAAARV